MKHRPSVRTWAWVLAIAMGPLTSFATELFPGRIRNPAGLQWDMNTVYNSAQDEYLLAYSDGRALIGHLTPDGVFYGEVAVSGNTGVTHVGLSYNPDADQYLFVWRNGSPNNIRAIYLTTEGNPIGSSFGIGNGGAVHVNYSPLSQLYIISYTETAGGIQYVRYKMVDGDSSATVPLVRGGIVATNNVLSDGVQWGGTAGKFLVVYAKDWAPNPRRADIYGNFISADGTTVGSQFGIDIELENQGKPRIAYADDIDRWLVAYEDWTEPGTSANMKGALVSPTGSVRARFQISSTVAWDVPGPIIYNPSTKTFIASWRSAFSDTRIESWAREIDPLDGSTSSVPQGPPVLLSDLNAGPLEAAVRTHPSDPQALVLWRVGFGADGIHAGIFHLPPAPPEINPPMPTGYFGVSYSEQVPVLGGRFPLTYEITAGGANLTPLGLAPAPDFATSGIIQGTPTALGTSSAFTVSVCDDDARCDEGDYTVTIELQPPALTSPSGEINTTTPDYTWSDTPGATQYNIVVDNVTDGGNVFDSTVPPSPYTSPALDGEKTYEWKVRATDGTNFSEFSATTSFYIDTAAPTENVSLAAEIPSSQTEAPVTPVDVSGEANSSWSKEMTADGDIATAWSTPGRSAVQNEFLTVDLGSVKTINAVKLRSRLETGLTFPADFEIQVATVENNFATWSTVTNFVAAAGTEYTVSFANVDAQWVKLLVTRVNVYTNGLFYTQLAEMKVMEAFEMQNALRVSWSAPGDDGSVGAASGYDLRYSTSPIPTDITHPNFLLLTQVPGVDAMSPQAAGQTEEILHQMLDIEATYYYALKSTDNAGNISLLSNVADGTTAGAAPEPVATLEVQNPDYTTLELHWPAPHEDGAVGGAASTYDIRQSTSPLTSANFGAADPVQVVGGTLPTPATPGVSQSVTVTNLSGATTYYFGLKSTDDASLTSLLSNTPMGTTLDNVAPDAAELSGFAGSVTPTVVAVTAVDSSGDANASYSKEMATDTDSATAWSTPGRTAPQTETLTVDTLAVRPLTRVRLQARDATSGLFPEDYEIQVSSDGTNFSTMVSATGVAAAAGEWITHDFPEPYHARYVRLNVTQARQYAGLYYVQLAEIEVSDTPWVDDAVTVRWTAPGDDEDRGTATRYDLCYSTVEIDVFPDFCASGGTLMLDIAVPGPAGTQESYTINGLTPEMRYYIALKTEDDEGNISEISTPNPSVAPNEPFYIDTLGEPPATVTNFRVTGSAGTTIDLAWTASGDDGNGGGRATTYYLCTSSQPITNFCSDPGAVLETFAVAQDPGQNETHQVASLQNETMYYFALQVADEVDNRSGLATANGETLDVVPPDPVQNFQANAGSTTYSEVSVNATAASGQASTSWDMTKATDTIITTAWLTPGRTTMQNEFLTVDTGAVRSIGRIRLLARDVLGDLLPEEFDIQVSSDNSVFTTVHTGSIPTPQAGQEYTFTLPTPETGRWVKLLVTRTRRYAANQLYYVQLAEMAVDEASSQSDQMALSWEATGDDGNIGTAAQYQLCYSYTEADVTAFCSPLGDGTLVSVPVTGPFGTQETYDAMGLAEETLYYFGIRALDEDGNESGVVTLSEMTADVPPAPVTLVASNPSTTSIDLDWEASGDNGTVGTATQYQLCYSTSNIDESNFCTDPEATQVNLGVSGPATTPEDHSVNSLDESTLYYFAIKVIDDRGNASVLSNVATETTLDGTNPEQILDLEVLQGFLEQQAPATAIDVSGEASSTWGMGMTTDVNTATAWSTPPRAIPQDEFITWDTGATRELTRVRLRSRDGIGDLFPEDFEIQVGDDPGPTFTAAVTQTGFTADDGTWYDFVLPAGTTGRYVRLYVTQSRLYTANQSYYTQVSEVEIFEQIPQNDRLLVKWTAPHEDGAGGGAVNEYILRYSTGPITSANFDSAFLVNGVPAPAAPGTQEGFTVTGLTPGTEYFFAIKSEDEADNLSDMSNVDSGTPGTP